LLTQKRFNAKAQGRKGLNAEIGELMLAGRLATSSTESGVSQVETFNSLQV